MGRNNYLVFALMFIFLIGMASAELLTFDNVKSYDAVNQEVLITNTFGIGTDIAKVKLNTPLENKVGIGYVQVAEFELTSYEDYKNLLSNAEFYNINAGMSKIEVNFDYKYKSYENYEVNDYDYVVSSTLNNGTNVYTKKLIGTHTEQREIWLPLEKLDYIKGDVITIGIFTNTYEGQRVEWIPTVAGMKISEFASWTAGLNTGIKVYYKLDETTGSVADDSLNYQDATNSGATVNQDGKMGTSYYFNRDEGDYINITSGFLYGPTTPFSYNFWYKPTEFTNDKVIFQVGTDSNGDLSWLLDEKTAGGNHLHLGCVEDAVAWRGEMENTFNTITNGEWYMITINYYANKTLEMYVNGGDRTTVTCTSTASSARQAILFATMYNGAILGGTQYMKGNLDEFGMWERTLTYTEINSNLYNSGAGNTYTNIFGALPIELNSPANAYKTNNTNVTLNWTIYPTAINITNYTLNIFYSNGTMAHQHTTLGNLGSTNLTVTHNDILLTDANYTWGVKAGGNNSIGTNFNGESANRTLQVHTTNPTITVTSPINMNYGAIGDTLRLNWTAIDPEIDKCWYNYNGTSVFVTCNTNTTTFIQQINDYNLTFYANDTFGNSNSLDVNWSYALLQNAITYNAITLEGSSESFVLNVTTNGTDINYAYLNYNNTAYLASLTKDGNNYIVSTTVTIPSVSAATNKTFYYSLTQDGNIFNSSSYLQLVNSILIDDCTLYTNVLFDLYLRDEESNANITNSSIETYVFINSTIEAEVVIYSKADLSTILTFAKLYYNKNPARICASSNLSTSSYYMDTTFKYFGEGYSQENYNIQRYNLNASTIYQNITLYDLLISKSAEFQISLLSKAYLPISDALIVVDRKYVSEGVFKTVEIAKTDTDGKTVIHLDEKDATYNIYAYKNGVLITSYLSVVAVCQDILTGTCTITLREPSGVSSIFNATSDKRITFDMSYSSSTKVLTLTFSSINATLYNVSIESYMESETGSSFICTNNLYAASGSITCNVTAASGKSSITTFIYVDGDLIDVNTLNIRSAGTFSTVGYFIFFILIVTIIFMFSGSKTGMVVGAILGIIACGYMGLVESGTFAFGSALIWLVVAGIILIYKLNSNGGGH